MKPDRFFFSELAEARFFSRCRAPELLSLRFNVPTDTLDGVVPPAVTDAIVARAAGQPVQPLAQVDGALTMWSGDRFRSLALDGCSQLQMQFQGVGCVVPTQYDLTSRNYEPVALYGNRCPEKK